MKVIVAILLSTMAVLMFVQLKSVDAASYNVGDAKGWGFGVGSWPQGKKFQAGDTLVFKYPSSVHNVVVVDSNGYSACTTPKGAPIHTSGNDQITLSKGQNYFICNFSGHCEAGLKIAVNAA
ncbi:Basic blue protein [Linum grandiflorum]